MDGGTPMKPSDAAASWRDKYRITAQQVEEIVDPAWAYKDLIIEGHVVALIGASGAGKSRIMRWVARNLAAAGLDVTYINADISAADAKDWFYYAEHAGFDLLLPDIAGGSMANVAEDLKELADDGADLSKHVFIIDTLKKIVDVISKKSAKEAYLMFRRLSARGATVILQGHTNKYTDDEGNPIYEGTGDLRSDVDELIYLIPQKQDDGTMLVSTKPDKVRGVLEPITFKIHADKTTVTREDNFIDVQAMKAAQNQLDKDGPEVEVITGLLQKKGAMSQSELVAACASCPVKIGKNKAITILRRYSISMEGRPKLWVAERLFQKNAWQYYLADG